MKEINSCFDHFCCCVENRECAEQLLHKMGFVYGNSAADDHIHVVFQRGYMELTTFREDEKLPSGKGGYVTVNMEKRSTMITLFFGSENLARTHEALKKSGYPVLDPMVTPFSRRAKHGPVTGTALFHGFIFANSSPFDPKTVLGIIQHGTPDLIYGNCYPQVNGAVQITKLLFAARDARQCRHFLCDLERLMDIIAPFSDTHHTIQKTAAVDAGEYEEMFAVPWDSDKEIDLAAVYLGGCDLQYLSEQIQDSNICCTMDKNRICVDCRKELGTFLVFEA